MTDDDDASVTAGMRVVGGSVIYEWKHIPIRSEELAEQVYLAMERVRRSGSPIPKEADMAKKEHMAKKEEKERKAKKGRKPKK